MSIIVAVVLAISATPSPSAADSAGASDSSAAPSVSSAAAAPASTPALRSGRQLEEATHATLRKWAKASNKEAEAAARDLFTIYRELQQDTRMARSTRESLRIIVRGRLDRLCTQITRQLARDKAAAKAGVAKVDAPNTASPVKSVAATDHDRPLAQVGAPVGGGAGLGGAGTGQNSAAADNGQALVDLIQNVIQPKCWDANGGNCTITYWQQQHALVVRAPSEVQGEISDALDQLNRAGH